MKCSDYNCNNEAIYWLRCNGKKVPGSWVCRDHAMRTLNEYAAKLPPDMGVWDAIPIDNLGRELDGEILRGEI